VKAVFTLASKISPSVIFIDEVLAFFLYYYMIPLGVGDLVCAHFCLVLMGQFLCTLVSFME
jgi:AAA+ superfamily predicted ATPase